MNLLKQWLALPTALVVAFGTAGTVVSQSIVITPASEPIQVSGTSGGSKIDSGCAGHIAASPNHVVQVAEDVNLRFTLQSQGQPALLIRSASGQTFCVPADSYSGGKVEIPGRWSKGAYSVYVGDRSNGQYPYSLSISRN